MKEGVAAAVGEPEEGMTELYILTSFYLAEYDVDYTANHHQSIEDVPGVSDITLNVAACTASRRREEGRRGGGGGGVMDEEKMVSQSVGKEPQSQRHQGEPEGT